MVTPRRRLSIAALVNAVASGAFATSPAIAERLKSTEAELAQLRVVQRAPVPRLEEHYRAKVKRLEATLASGDIPKARTGLLEAVGEIQVVTTPTEVRFIARGGVLARVAGLELLWRRTA